MKIYLRYSYVLYSIPHLQLLFYNLQSSWSIPVELVIGPDLGISYMAHRGGTVVRFHTYIFYIILLLL